MKKLLSSILMVTGTTIGGGMVMLPAVIGKANCYLPTKTSLISMSRRLLRYGEWTAWIVCLVFLYTIMCAYTTGMTEIISGFLENTL